MGNHGHSSDAAARVNEWIEAGVLGAVREVHIWTNRPIWPQGVPRPLKSAPWQGRRRFWQRVDGAPAQPGHLDRGCRRLLGADRRSTGISTSGRRPQVDYHPIYHPFNWRGWLDWGTGALGDMAAHLMDHPYRALKLGYPTSVEATSTPWGLARTMRRRAIRSRPRRPTTIRRVESSRTRS
jgi:predicted dehydrogenase